MSELIPVLYDPLEIILEEAIKESHLDIAGGYVPILKKDDIKKGDLLPITTCETLDLSVEEDGINASTGFMITIWVYYPEIELCSSRADLAKLAVLTVKSYAADLIELSNLFISREVDDRYPDAEYRIQGKRIIRPRYKDDLFDSKLEAKNHKLSDKLMGVTLTGRLAGNLKYICCSTKNFRLD